MPILPIISAERTLNKVLCLALDIKHSAFENGEYNICNDTVPHYHNTDNDTSSIEWQVGKLSTDTYSHKWDAIAYGNGKFVAISSDAIKYSTDGIMWKTIDNPATTSATWNIVFGDGKFVAISSAFESLCSTDGITWTQGTFLKGKYRHPNIAYGNGKFVIVTFSLTDMHDVVVYSTDGITWTQVDLTTTLGIQAFNSLVYGNNQFIAYANLSTDVIYSTDGITWSAMTNERNAYNVTVCNNIFFASCVWDDSSVSLGYSTDGIMWTQCTIPDSFILDVDITYGNGTYIGIARNALYLIYSTDGETWTLSSFTSPANKRITAYGSNKFVTLTYGENTEEYSTDGITWTEKKIEWEQNWRDITYSNALKKFYAIIPNSNMIAYSEDGTVWEQSSLPVSANWSCITCSDNAIVATAPSLTNLSLIMYSLDGITWEESTVGMADEWQQVVYDKNTNTFYVISPSGVVLRSSDNGASWNYTSSLSFETANTEWKNITCGDGVHIATAIKGVYAYTSNFATWTQGSMPSTDDGYVVTYGNGKFVAIGINTNIAVYSADGINWKQVTLPITAEWQALTYNNGMFIALANNLDKVVYSVDGIYWRYNKLPTTVEKWGGIAYGNDKFVSLASNTDTYIYSSESLIQYLPCPFTFNIPSQSETDDTNISITNVGLLSSQILSKADNSLEDIIVHGWLIVADYNGNSSWISLGEYYLSTQQNETVDAVSATLIMKTCYGVNAGKYRGDNPNIFINLNYR